MQPREDRPFPSNLLKDGLSLRPLPTFSADEFPSDGPVRTRSVDPRDGAFILCQATRKSSAKGYRDVLNRFVCGEI
jgi:hypothetical protein